MPISPYNYDVCINTQGKHLSRKVYKFLAEDVMLIHNKYMKWRSILGEEFDIGLYDFGLLHKDIYTIMNVAKFRSFQYRLLQRGLVTNTLLCEIE